MSIRLSTIKENSQNPRIIKDQKFDQLVQSLKDFPEMMTLRPIVVDENNIALGGNMRLKALQKLGYKTIPEVWIKKAKDLTEEQKKEFIIKDNVGFGEWDWDMIANEWDQQQVTEWGLNIPGWGHETEQKDLSDSENTDYKIEVICKNEEDQEKAYNFLLKKGYECRLLTL